MKLVNFGNKDPEYRGYRDQEYDQYLEFDNGMRLEYYHDQDCCEDVYADFQNMQVMGPQEKNYVDARDLDFFENILDSIVPIEGLGFYIVTKQGICILVSCYDIQNGYYNDRLELVYGDERKDITQCTKEDRW